MRTLSEEEEETSLGCIPIIKEEKLKDESSAFLPGRFSELG